MASLKLLSRNIDLDVHPITHHSDLMLVLKSYWIKTAVYVRYNAKLHYVLANALVVLYCLSPSNLTWKLALSVLLCINPANLEEKILVSQVFCLTILKLWFDLATSAWILGIYAGFPFEFVGFFFQENGVFPLARKTIVTLAKNLVKNTRFSPGKQLRSGILQYSCERFHVWVCITPASLATFVL